MSTNVLKQPPLMGCGHSKGQSRHCTLPSNKPPTSHMHCKSDDDRIERHSNSCSLKPSVGPLPWEPHFVVIRRLPPLERPLCTFYHRSLELVQPHQCAACRLRHHRSVEIEPHAPLTLFLVEVITKLVHHLWREERVKGWPSGHLQAHSGWT